MVTVKKTESWSFCPAVRNSKVQAESSEIVGEGERDWSAPLRATPAPGQPLKKNLEMYNHWSCGHREQFIQFFHLSLNRYRMSSQDVLILFKMLAIVVRQTGEFLISIELMFQSGRQVVDKQTSK